MVDHRARCQRAVRGGARRTSGAKRMRPYMPVRALAFALALGTLCPAAATAQASPFLPAQHWAHGALRELEVRGAVGTDALDAGSRSTTVVHAIATFARAASNEKASDRVRARAE